MFPGCGRGNGHLYTVRVATPYITVEDDGYLVGVAGDRVAGQAVDYDDGPAVVVTPFFILHSLYSPTDLDGRYGLLLEKLKCLLKTVLDGYEWFRSISDRTVSGGLKIRFNSD